MKLLNRFFLLIFLALIILSAFNWELISYAISQARGQLYIVNNAMPITQVLNNDSFEDSVKQKVRLVQDVRSFAFHQLGLNKNENYTTYFDQKGRELMYVVTACKPYQLEAHEWEFPILGAFSYKGFFDEDKAVEEAEKLEKQGLDVNIRNAGGWSTLGWFKDPILSGMLNRNEALLAELIIHELTHGTLFVKDSLRFNESLATFVGVEGTKRYLAEYFGDSSDITVRYNKHLEEKAIFQQYVQNQAKNLQQLYQSMNDSLSMSKREKLKNGFFTDFVQGIEALPLENKEDLIAYYSTRKLNNTFFMRYIRYRGDIPKLQKMLQEDYNERLPDMIADLKKKFKSL
ncbi:MAG TPA: aminopeptidase [Cytophagales bacterium]|jgi:predicted aminopeptidase|nr:aminopeptidase [Cytophagales bacterium]